MRGFCPLASGSKGNCIYFGTSEIKILIDAGISVKMMKAKLAEIGVTLEEIDAVFITHDHGDHIQGLKTLTARYQIPVFANHETAKGIVEFLNFCPKFKIFSTGESFEFCDIEVLPFTIQHDTMDPVAFTIRTKDLKLGFCADLGFVTPLVQHHLKECDYLYLEANHQPEMVHASSRPFVYKQRVLSRTGHLSNEECGKLLLEVAHPKLKLVHLAHLSSECNTPKTALSIVTSILGERGISLNLDIAYQDQISQAVYF